MTVPAALPRNLVGRRGLAVRSSGQVAIELLVIVLVALGCSLRAGEYSLAGLIAILTAVALAITAALAKPSEVSKKLARRLWLGAVVVCALLNLMPALLPSRAGVGVAATALLVACVVALFFQGLSQWGWLVAGLGAGADLLLAAAKITWGKARIDVFWFTQNSAEQLLRGHDPYIATYPTTTPHLLSAHFPFGPDAVLVAAPFRLLGDVRVANAVAMIAIFWAVATLARRSGGPLHAGRCLGLTMALPFVATMIANDWPEVFAVAGVTLWLVGRDRHRSWSVVALGAGLAAVPTAAPLLVFSSTWWRSVRVEVMASVLVAIGLAIPFALWVGPQKFISDTIGLQLQLGPRADGLGLNGLMWHLHLGWLPWWFGIGVCAVFTVKGAMGSDRSRATALSLGSTLALVAFVSAKWAFFNYYFIVAVGLVLALASCQKPAPRRVVGMGECIANQEEFCRGERR